MPDLRSPSALARDQWLLSDEGKRCCEGSASGIYLENRLVRAFLAGMKTQEKLQEARNVQ